MYVKVDNILIEHLSHLARLNVNEVEREELKVDLQKMINFVNNLQEVDTTGVKPLLSIALQNNVLRDDVVISNTSKEDILLNAPNKNNNFFKVLKVIKK